MKCEWRREYLVVELVRAYRVSAAQVRATEEVSKRYVTGREHNSARDINHVWDRDANCPWSSITLRAEQLKDCQSLLYESLLYV